MTREEIIKLAQEAGADFQCETLLVNGKDAHDFIERFAELVAQAEREACAKLCDQESDRAVWNWNKDLPANKQFWNGGEALASSCANSIRARKD